jgi:hypothetical protein
MPTEFPGINPNAGGPPGKSAPMLLAHNGVYHDASHVVLPVIPGP